MNPESSSVNAPDNSEEPVVQDKFKHWFETSVERIRASAAMVVLRQGEHIQGLCGHPAEAKLDAALQKVAIHALDQGGFVQRETNQDGQSCAVVGLSMRLTGRPGAVVFRIDAEDTLPDHVLLLHIQRNVLRREDDAVKAASVAKLTAVKPVPESLWADADLPSVNADDNPVENPGASLEIVAALLDYPDAARSSRAFVDSLAIRFGCQRVTMGTLRGRRTVLDAVSGTADFDARSSAMTDIADAIEETISLGRVIVLRPSDQTDQSPPAHTALSRNTQKPALLSLPLVDANEVAGAVLFERDTEFSADEIEQLVQLFVLSAPIIALKTRDAHGPLRKLSRSLRHKSGQIFGLKNLTAKLVFLCLAAFVVFSTQYKQVFSVEADASIEATVQRAVVAGANSYISQVEKRAGDVVYKGDVLARLDVEELQLERIKWEGERDKIIKEQRATMAQRDRTRVRILSAKRAQAQNQIEFLDAQIARAVLRTPIDGVVIAGDLSESLGSPVERGQVLFEVASLTDYRLVLLIDEADIGEIAEGYSGRLRLRSLPHETFEFVVTGITPVSQAAEGTNRFRLEAELAEPPTLLRPGMGGIAKIDAGEQPVGWIWTRSFVNWAKLQLWKRGLL
ncbi:MAG: efflux RND transporter periplasmic adaptor subunit [Gammaproteobacteria bacterium]